MLLILELGLTIAAWRRGWRFRALIPLAGLMGVAFLIGVAVEVAGGTFENVTPLVILLDLATVGMLVVLTSRAPANARVAPAEVRHVQPVIPDADLQAEVR